MMHVFLGLIRDNLEVSVEGEYIDVIVQGYFTQDSLVASKSQLKLRFRQRRD